MQAAQPRFREHDRARGRLMSGLQLRYSSSLTRRARPRTQCTVRASTVVVNHPLAQDRTQVRLGHREHPVQALPANGADDPLADRVRLRARDGRSQHFDAQGSDRIVQVLGEDRITIMSSNIRGDITIASPKLGSAARLSHTSAPVSASSAIRRPSIVARTSLPSFRAAPRL